MKRIVLFIGVLLLLVCPAYAADDMGDWFGVLDVWNAAPESASESTNGLSPDTVAGGVEKGLSNLMRMATKLSKTALGEGLRVAAGIALIAALCAAVGGLFEGVPVQYVRIAAVLGIAALSLTGLQSLLEVGKAAMNEMDTYSKALLPSMAAAAAASGQPASAVARQAATALASDLLITLFDRLLVPLLYIYAALITLNAALPQDILRRLAGLVKWLVCGTLTLGVTAFVMYLTVSGAVSGQADRLAARGAKVAISGMVPVVGGIISDASETVLIGAGVIKNSMGVFGMFVVLGILLSPMLTLGARYLIFKLGAALCGTVGDETIAGYVDGLASLYAMLLGIIGAAGFLLLFSIVSCMTLASSI